MTHEAFIKKYLGRYLDYDHFFGNQCTDLMRFYIKEVYYLDPYKAVPAGPTAKQIFTNFKDNAFFKKVLNTPNGIPKKGDIVFWKTSTLPPWHYGMAGHVAVIDSASLYSMIVLEQNYPTNKPVRLQKHSYKDCLGWLTRTKAEIRM
jgi:hypothetical protein